MVLSIQERRLLIEVAKGMKPADLYLEGGNLINVYSGEILPANVALSGHRDLVDDPLHPPVALSRRVGRFFTDQTGGRLDSGACRQRLRDHPLAGNLCGQRGPSKEDGVFREPGTSHRRAHRGVFLRSSEPSSSRGIAFLS